MIARQPVSLAHPQSIPCFWSDRGYRDFSDMMLGRKLFVNAANFVLMAFAVSFARVNSSTKNSVTIAIKE